jgi:hypothetical protein
VLQQHQAPWLQSRLVLLLLGAGYSVQCKAQGLVQQDSSLCLVHQASSLLLGRLLVRQSLLLQVLLPASGSSSNSRLQQLLVELRVLPLGRREAGVGKQLLLAVDVAARRGQPTPRHQSSSAARTSSKNAHSSSNSSSTRSLCRYC